MSFRNQSLWPERMACTYWPGLGHLTTPGKGGGASHTGPRRIKGRREDNLFNKHLLITYCVPSPGLGAGDTAVNKTEKSLPLWG